MVFSFVSIPLGGIVGQCLIGNFDGTWLLLFFLILLVSGIIIFASGFKTWKIRLLIAGISIFIVLSLVFIVLSSLNTARMKARSAGIQATISFIRTQAEYNVTYNVKNDKYYYPSNLCNEETGPLREQFKYIKNNGASNIICSISSDLETWVFSAGLPLSGVYRQSRYCKEPIFNSKIEKSDGFFCTDSTGFSGRLTTQITGPNCGQPITQ